MIDISPMKMFATCEVIKFIAKNSVTAGGKEMEKQFCAGEIKNERFA